MIDVELDPLEYLAPPHATFWAWDGDAEAAVWAQDGATISFRLELEHILRTLAKNGCGLPPLSLLLLVLAACQESWFTVIEEDENVGPFAVRTGFEDAESITRLAKIARLKPELRRPIEAKCQLLQFLFESVDIYPTEENAHSICDALLLNAESLGSQLPEAPVSKRDYRAGIAALFAGLERLTEEVLLLRMTTGLDELPLPAEIYADDRTQTRDLISSLLDDREFGGLARLSRALMAVVHLPRPLLEPEELPLGGFSDIENRGSLDRLLVSELAHDDLTLAVRVALNEALYLRRETPPKTPTLARSILVDVGIRMWGVPRVFAASVALALVATADHHTGTSVFRARKSQIEPANLTTRKGLAEHLGVLDSDSHPGRALAQFLVEANQAALRSDRIIVTCTETAADPQFQQCLARQESGCVYLATVERTGVFQLLQQGVHGRKLICEAKLSLDDLLLRRQRSGVPLIDRDKELTLPAIFQEDPFPLLIHCNRFNERQSWSVPGHGVFEIAADQRLLLWNRPGRGPQQIVENVPSKASTYAAGREIQSNEVIAFLAQPGEPLQLLAVDVVKRRAKLTSLKMGEPPPDVTFTCSAQGGHLFAIAEHEVQVLSRNGVRIACIPTKCEPSNLPLRHHRDRFFIEDRTNIWYALSDRSPPQFEMIFDPATDPHFELVAMFDRVGHEGPVGITRQGELYYPDEKRLLKINERIAGPIEVVDVSPCGEWVEYYQSETPYRYRYLVALSTGEVESYPRTSARQKAAMQWVHPCRGHLHRYFTGVAACGADGVVPNGLALISTKRMVWMIEYLNGSLRLRPNVRPAVDLHAEVRVFDERVGLPDAAYGLNVATWPDGSQVFLDTRGLLHLRSSDDAIPETTLVLVDGEMAGWCEDGRVWGDPYLTGDHANSGASEIFENVLQPFLERLM